MALIFVMVDGVGLGPRGPHNPVPGAMRQMARILGAGLDADLGIEAPSVHAVAIDATLGVAGLPQSGSGHTSIYGGYNAAAANGRHQPSYPTLAMRDELRRRNLLLDVLAQGRHVAWANAYLPGYRPALEGRRLRHTAGTWSALFAGLPLRGLDELLAGTALSWDITQELARRRPGCDGLPVIPPEEAGERLARLAHAYNLVAFETYLPDLAAHGRLALSPERSLELVDALLAGIAGAKRAGDTVIVTSDHGNVEDATTRVHTRAPVPLIVLGPAAGAFREVTAIDGVMDAIVKGLRE